MNDKPLRVIFFKTSTDTSPVEDWLDSLPLKDQDIIARLYTKIGGLTLWNSLVLQMNFVVVSSIVILGLDSLNLAKRLFTHALFRAMFGKS
jgi:hypothetical protein